MSLKPLPPTQAQPHPTPTLFATTLAGFTGLSARNVCGNGGGGGGDSAGWSRHRPRMHYSDSRQADSTTMFLMVLLGVVIVISVLSCARSRNTQYLYEDKPPMAYGAPVGGCGQPGMGYGCGPGYGPGYGGGYGGYSGGSVAGSAAAGFLGGMVVSDLMHHSGGGHDVHHYHHSDGGDYGGGDYGGGGARPGPAPAPRDTRTPRTPCTPSAGLLAPPQATMAAAATAASAPTRRRALEPDDRTPASGVQQQSVPREMFESGVRALS